MYMGSLEIPWSRVRFKSRLGRHSFYFTLFPLGTKSQKCKKPKTGVINGMSYSVAGQRRKFLSHLSQVAVVNLNLPMAAALSAAQASR